MVFCAHFYIVDLVKAITAPTVIIDFVVRSVVKSCKTLRSIPRLSLTAIAVGG